MLAGQHGHIVGTNVLRLKQYFVTLTTIRGFEKQN